jgi:hypothetical protein
MVRDESGRQGECRKYHDSHAVSTALLLGSTAAMQEFKQLGGIEYCTDAMWTFGKGLLPLMEF